MGSHLHKEAAWVLHPETQETGCEARQLQDTSARQTKRREVPQQKRLQ